jgi:hypothetical protein
LKTNKKITVKEAVPDNFKKEEEGAEKYHVTANFGFLLRVKI